MYFAHNFTILIKDCIARFVNNNTIGWPFTNFTGVNNIFIFGTHGTTSTIVKSKTTIFTQRCRIKIDPITRVTFPRSVLECWSAVFSTIAPSYSQSMFTSRKFKIGDLKGRWRMQICQLCCNSVVVHRNNTTFVKISLKFKGHECWFR